MSARWQLTIACCLLALDVRQNGYVVPLQLLPASDTLESRFALLEGGAGGVDDELLKLKTNMLAGAPAKTLRLSDTLSESGYINIPVR